MTEQIVELAPGESKAVSFEAIPHEARTYQVSVDGLAGSFKVIARLLTEVRILSATFTWDGTTLYGIKGGSLVIKYEVLYLSCPSVFFRARAYITQLGTVTGSGEIGTHQVSIYNAQIERVDNFQYIYFDGYATQMYKIYKL